MENILESPSFDLNLAKRILAVQPHYDDNDISAGGTLYTLGKTGAEIIYLTVTDDLAGIRDQQFSSDKASQAIVQNQNQAAGIIGVQEQIRFDFPDASAYDYFQLRDQIIREIWKIKPDLIISVDPWMPYEAHRDHIQTGRAVAEAAILYDLPSYGGLNTKDTNDYQLQAVAFYNTAYPNLVFDITEAIIHKQNALRSYTAQFSAEALEKLILQTTFLASYLAQEKNFEYGETFKVIAPWMLHCFPLTMQL